MARMTLDRDSLPLLGEALERLEAGFAGLPPFEPALDVEAWRPILLEVADRLHDNYPYPHPLYAGQMLTPPHAIARLAYMLAMWINPNNHALDGGRASSAMEREAVAELAALFGWQTHLGHLAGGGTLANLEALWVAGRERSGLAVVASSQAHYTHQRLCGVLGIPFRAVACDGRGRMSVAALEAALASGDVGCVVATLGTTAVGAVDPLPEVLELAARHHVRVHVDAAYGGYFTLADNLEPPARAAFARIGEADSIVVDPHKLGLQPYGCGCVLFRDPGVARHYRHESPYTYFTSAELHLGEVSLECSRAGASAVALWATQRLLPLTRGGEFAAMMSARRRAALALRDRLGADPRWLPPFEPETNIVVWAPRGERASDISRRSRAVFDAAARAGLHLACATLPRILFDAHWPEVAWDTDEVVCLRSCLMKPEQEAWIDRIVGTLQSACDSALGGAATPGSPAE